MVAAPNKSAMAKMNGLKDENWERTVSSIYHHSSGRRLQTCYAIPVIYRCEGGDRSSQLGNRIATSLTLSIAFLAADGCAQHRERAGTGIAPDPTHHPCPATSALM
jgi:hypothetical protein